jgi:diguanylate cyclase (GGDEF)-like protein
VGTGLTLLAIFAVWAAIVVQLGEHRRNAIDDALHHAEGINRAYVQYVERTVRQMDQVTRFVAFDRADGLSPEILREFCGQILGPFASPVMLSLADSRGNVTLTSAPEKTDVKVDDRDYFIEIRDNPGFDTYYAQTKMGRISFLPSMQISRRLKTRVGRFDGVVILSFPPQMLTNFYQTDDLGANGLLAVAGTDGVYRAMQVGPSFSYGQGDLGSAVRVQLTGSMLVDSVASVDHVARFVAWRRVEGFPLVALTGVSAVESLAGFNEVKRLYVRGGVIVSTLLLILGFGATGLLFRLENRRRAVLEAKESYRTASEGTQDGFYILNPVFELGHTLTDFVFTDANARGAQMVGHYGQALTNRRLSAILPGDTFAYVLRQYEAVLRDGVPIEDEEIFVTCAGPLQGKWINHRAVPARQGLAVTVRDITKIKEHEASLVFVANHDAVTSLPNRNWLHTYLPQAINRAATTREKVGVFFIDLDDFKKVNDTLGHTVGDQLLTCISDRLRRISRDSDVVCRLGGDEFTLVVHGKFARTDMEALGARIVDTLAQPFELEGQTILIGASVGISVYPDSGANAAELLKNADLAMYSAKESGKGLYEFFSPGLSAQVASRVALEREMHCALKNDEFFLVYQPKVDLHTQETCGFEALLRWQSPTRGIVPPLDFIGLAEKTGLILPIGEKVLEMACEQLVAWRAQGLNLLPVSVNVSPRQLRRGNLASMLAEMLARYQLPSHLLEIELTESSMMEDPDFSRKQLQSIKELGVRILVDDFGTGYSSLALLKQFEVDVLKVDRSFVNDVPRDPEDCAILSAVVSMARALRMEVVAEGVETMEQREYLASLGCHQGQGYFFSRPVRAQDLGAWFVQPRERVDLEMA